jgi:toxin-antitoxin system PIN domain toxin
MRSLLDVNVIVALLDEGHAMHSVARDWFAAHASGGWASCPITQNGCMRIMSHPGYPSPVPIAAVAERLTEAAATPLHEFWPDDLSLLDARAVDLGRVHGPRQLTDVYLLALAVRRRGRLVSFDGSIPLAAVPGAAKKDLVAL